MAKVDKYSIHGLKRRPTYSEIIGMLDDNEKITGKLPDRSATMFRNSPEGSYFDGSDAMEQLREEQGRLLLRQMSDLLLRQNVRTAGRTYHAERTTRLPATSPTIAQPTQPMDVEQETTNQTQATPTAPTFSTQQASQIQAELNQRMNNAVKRRTETSVNHRGEMFKQNKPTITEQIHHINPPRIFTPIKPEDTPIPMSDQDELMTDAQMRNRTKATSSTQPPPPSPLSLPRPATTQHFFIGTPNETKTPKRNSPETAIEPKGKAGRPKRFQADNVARGSEAKREGSSPEDEPKTRKRRNNKRTDLSLAMGEADNEADVEDNRPRNVPRVLKPYQIGVQRLKEGFETAINRNMITKEQFEEWNKAYQIWFASRGNESKKKQMLKVVRDVYRKHLWKKLEEAEKINKMDNII